MCVCVAVKRGACAPFELAKFAFDVILFRMLFVVVMQLSERERERERALREREIAISQFGATNVIARNKFICPSHCLF